ncbi:phage protein Gp36 family protein [Sphingomonas sp. CJ99]
MYVTADEMRARYGEGLLVQITNADAWDAVAIAAVNAAVSDACVLADGYVAKYHQATPGVEAPPLLKRLVREIAFADLQQSPTEESAKRKADAIRTLEMISRGLVKLDQGEGNLPARDGAVIVPDRERIFSRDRMGGF